MKLTGTASEGAEKSVLLKGTASEPALSEAEWVPQVFYLQMGLLAPEVRFFVSEGTISATSSAAEVRFLFREALFQHSLALGLRAESHLIQNPAGFDDVIRVKRSGFSKPLQ
jgi:hypothetical protein